MTTNTVQRPFRVLGMQQVAIGGTDKGRMKTLWVDMLGLTQTGTFQSERENVDEDILAMGQGAFKVEVDIMPTARHRQEARCAHYAPQPHRSVD
jgi:lactoylglutathione lyase